MNRPLAHSLAAVRFVVEAPAQTPEGSRLYLSGSVASMGAWSSAGLELHPAGHLTWAGTVELPVGTVVEYKVTRGGWPSVETTAFGHEVPNRTLAVISPATEELRVAGWRDVHEPLPSPGPIEGTVSMMTVESRILRGPRRVWVYRPSARMGRGPFPLLMCLDGQNVFQWGRAEDSMPFSWALDMTADRLIREKRMAPIVIAAVANSGQRTNEYTPWHDPHHMGGGRARRFFTALRDELMPAVQRLHPVHLSAPTNGILGSSLGGLFSFWAALQEPPLFLRGAAVSPSLGWGQFTVRQFIRARKLSGGLKLWMDFGTQELAGVPTVFQEFFWTFLRENRRELEALGWPPDSLFHYEEVPDAGHTEADWAARADRILKFLYPPHGK